MAEDSKNNDSGATSSSKSIDQRIKDALALKEEGAKVSVNLRDREIKDLLDEFAPKPKVSMPNNPSREADLKDLLDEFAPKTNPNTASKSSDQLVKEGLELKQKNSNTPPVINKEIGQKAAELQSLIEEFTPKPKPSTQQQSPAPRKQPSGVPGR